MVGQVVVAMLIGNTQCNRNKFQITLLRIGDQASSGAAGIAGLTTQRINVVILRAIVFTHHVIGVLYGILIHTLILGASDSIELCSDDLAEVG